MVRIERHLHYFNADVVLISNWTSPACVNDATSVPYLEMWNETVSAAKYIFWIYIYIFFSYYSLFNIFFSSCSFTHQPKKGAKKYIGKQNVHDTCAHLHKGSGSVHMNPNYGEFFFANIPSLLYFVGPIPFTFLVIFLFVSFTALSFYISVFMPNAFSECERCCRTICISACVSKCLNVALLLTRN